MNPLMAAHIGSYPRIGDDKDQQRHRRGIANFQNKEISAHALRDVEQSVIQEVMAEQLSAGLDEITDGLVSWHDPISHFTRTLSNTKTAGLRRYFNTNFYFRVPVINGLPRKKEPCIVDEFVFAKQNSPKPVRAILTGPLTLAYHCESDLKSFQKFEKRVALFNDVLADEIKKLELAGCQSIQIDEPIMGQFPELLPHLKKSIQHFRNVIKSAKLILAVYYYPLSALYDDLSLLPIDVLQLDFTNDGKRLWETILKKPFQTSLGFGMLNSRSTRLDAIDPILNVVRIWMESRRPPICYVTPSSTLEHLPRHIAQAKINLLGKIKTELSATYG